MTDELRIERRAGVVRFTLNRPHKRNALTRTLLTRFRAELQELAHDPGDLRLCILAAEGTAFCAGMDLGEMQETAVDPRAVDLWRLDTQLYRDVVGLLWGLSAPVMGIIHGPAVGGGVGLIAACDVVLGTPEARFSLPEAQRGILAAMVTPLLVYRIGSGPAGHLLLSGISADGELAQRWGLIHELAPLAELPRREAELVDSILRGAPSALAATKRWLQTCSGERMSKWLDTAIVLSAAARETADAREGLAAFLEKRRPNWSPDE